MPAGIYAIAQADLRAKSRLVRLDLSTDAIVDVALTNPSRCLANAPTGIQPLGDGRILVNSSCPNGGVRELDALDPTTGISQLLLGDLDGAGASSWDLRTGTGVTELNSSLCSSIVFLDAKQGRVVRPVTIGDGNRQWTLADYFDVTAQQKAAVNDPNAGPMVLRPNCESAEAGGLASSPALSPDHTTIAFFASTDALGKKGQARPNSDFELWFMGPQGENPRQVLAGFNHPQGTMWSPNGTCIAFTATYQSRTGWWMYHPGDRNIYLLAEGKTGGATWSPDGTRLAILDPIPMATFPMPANVDILSLDGISELRDCAGTRTSSSGRRV